MTKQLTIELTDVIPYLDERPITEQRLTKLGFTFQKEGYWIYIFNNFMTLITKQTNSDESLIVGFLGWEDVNYTTMGSIRMLIMAIEGENNEELKESGGNKST